MSEQFREGNERQIPIRKVIAVHVIVNNKQDNNNTNKSSEGQILKFHQTSNPNLVQTILLLLQSTSINKTQRKQQKANRTQTVLFQKDHIVKVR